MSAAQKPITAPLLVEIGCEEIPARFLTQAQNDFGQRLEGALKEARLVHFGVVTAGSEGAKSTSLAGPPRTFSTPRRLVAYVPEVLAKQLDRVEEITGPPVKVAFDAAGKPTRAAESFAEKNGARTKDLVRVTTPKGEYLAIKKTTRGRPALELLSEILPAAITGLGFPKSMYWVAKSGPRFVRPIRWILALLGQGKRARVVPFEIAGVKAGDTTYGHRGLGQRAIRVQGFNDYAKKLRESQVEFDPAQRWEVLGRQLKVLLEDSNLKIIPNPRLEDWIVNSIEWPRALLGGFEERSLKLPREILITVMREHQKYFAVVDQGGNLQPRFITVLNVNGDPKGLIRAGHERVLTARFRDAEFFWQADQKIPLRDRVPMLQSVMYQAKLGSYAHKVRRMETVAHGLCEELVRPLQRNPLEAGLVLRSVTDPSALTDQEKSDTTAAVKLCKCDLTTQMVKEFPELQGIVGGLYARAQGERDSVAQAITEHYLPTGTDRRTPEHKVAKLVALADKIDSLVAGFAVGNIPTGSSDPFGLRRQAYGIVAILCEGLGAFSRSLGLIKLIEVDVEALRSQGVGVPDGVVRSVREFVEERLGYYLTASRHLAYDTVRSVLAAGWDDPVDAMARATSLDLVRREQGEVIEALSVAAKRIKNILAKSATANDWKPGEPEQALLKEEPERQLYAAYQAVASETLGGGNGIDYRQRLERIATLRPIVDRFFDKVLVMAEDRGLRENRLRLLGKLDELFSSIADLSQIESTTLDVVDASTSRAEKPSAVSRQPSANASGKRSG